MPCHVMELDGGRIGYLCAPGAYRLLRRAACPHCCVGNARTIHAWREVHSGYVAPDMVCGRCGQYWTYDHDRLPKVSQRERDKNVAMVAALKRVARAAKGGAE